MLRDLLERKGNGNYRDKDIWMSGLHEQQLESRTLSSKLHVSLLLLTGLPPSIPTSLYRKFSIVLNFVERLI